MAPTDVGGYAGMKYRANPSGYPSDTLRIPFGYPSDTLRIPFGRPAEWLTGARPSPLNCPRPIIGCWAFDVGCWMFRSPAKPLPEPPNATSPLALSEGYPLDLPAFRLPTCSTGKHRPLGNLHLPLTPNFSWVCGGRRGDGTASAVSPSRLLARIRGHIWHRLVRHGPLC